MLFFSPPEKQDLQTFSFEWGCLIFHESSFFPAENVLFGLTFYW